MPVIRISALPPPSTVQPGEVIAEVSLRVAQVMGVPAEQVWTIWQTIAAGHYTEGSSVASSQPRATHPPIVELIAFEGRPPELIEQALVCAADALVECLGLDPGNAFVVYREAFSGQIYTGGVVRRRTR